MHGAHGRFKILAVALLLAAIVLPDQLKAQDLEPRRWGHLPTGVTVVGVGYAYTENHGYNCRYQQLRCQCPLHF